MKTEEIKKTVKKVLIVDDISDIVKLAKMTVTYAAKKAGIECDVTTCDSLDNALAALNSTVFDVVVTDFNIPVGTEGAIITQAAKQSSPATTVIVMSGALETDGDNIRKLCGADIYLAKPVEIPKIGKIVCELLTSSREVFQAEAI